MLNSFHQLTPSQRPGVPARTIGQHQPPFCGLFIENSITRLARYQFFHVIFGTHNFPLPTKKEHANMRLILTMGGGVGKKPGVLQNSPQDDGFFLPKTPPMEVFHGTIWKPHKPTKQRTHTGLRCLVSTSEQARQQVNKRTSCRDRLAKVDERQRPQLFQSAHRVLRHHWVIAAMPSIVEPQNHLSGKNAQNRTLAWVRALVFGDSARDRPHFFSLGQLPQTLRWLLLGGQEAIIRPPVARALPG